MPDLVLLSTVMWGLWLLLMEVSHRTPGREVEESLAQKAT